MTKEYLARSAKLYVLSCIAESSPPHANELARRMDISNATLHRWFVSLLKTTPSRFLKRIRDDLADEALAASTGGLDLFATAAGFGSRETLFRAYRQKGTTPALRRAEVAS